MITVFFNEDGYYVTGDGVESTHRCSPALTVEGDRIFQPIHHMYKILYLALCEIRDMQVSSDVMVYNDSRIMDEVNGLIKPLDDTCDRWVRVIRQDIIPTILPVVFFRKKPTAYINTIITTAQIELLSKANNQEKQKIALRDSCVRRELEKKHKRGVIARLRQSWFRL